MDLDEEPNEQWHEQCPREYVGTNDVQAKISQHHQTQSFEDRQLVRDLRIELYVVGMVRGMPESQRADGVQAEVEEKEHHVIDNKTGDQFHGNSP